MTEIVSRQETENGMLPESWEWAAYSELGEWFGGGTPSKSTPRYWEDGNVPWFSPKDMRELELHDSLDHITEDALRNSAAKPIRAGSLLFVVRSGILRRILPVALTTIDGAVNQDIKALTPSKSSSAKYLLYATLAQREDIRHKCKKAGTTVESIQVPLLQEYRLPISPLNEQRRIVEKIEELFAKLDAGVRFLKQTQALLKSYRRSVLKAAVEGELSREWREAHRDELEPASELLERILQERRENFAGKKYKEPVSPSISELATLPEGWAWAKSDQLFSFVTSGSRGWAKYYSDEGAIFLRIGNLDHDSIVLDLQSLQNVQPPTGAEGTRTRVVPKDVLISITADVGMVAVITSNLEEAYINQHIALARPADPVYVDYLAWHLVSEPGNKQLTGRQYGATKAGLNLDDIRTVDVPFPPLKEQRFIVEEIERRLSVVDKLEATVEANLKQASGLRQSILKKAFSGELVPQDPEDEPAGVLLARIREERQAAGRKPGKSKAKGDAFQGRLI